MTVMVRQYEIGAKPIPPVPTYPVPKIPKFPDIIPIEKTRILTKQPYFLPGYGGHKPTLIHAAGKVMMPVSHAAEYYPFTKAKSIFTDYEDYSNNKDYPFNKLREYLQKRELNANTKITMDYVPPNYQGFTPNFGHRYGYNNFILKSLCQVELKKGLDKFEDDRRKLFEDDVLKPNYYRTLSDSLPFTSAVTPLHKKSSYFPTTYNKEKCCNKVCHSVYSRGMKSAKYVWGHTGHKPGVKNYYGINNRCAQILGLVDFNHKCSQSESRAAHSTLGSTLVEEGVKYVPLTEDSAFFRAAAKIDNHIQPNRFEFYDNRSCLNIQNLFEKRKSIVSSRAGLKEDLRRRGFLDIESFKIKSKLNC